MKICNIGIAYQDEATIIIKTEVKGYAQYHVYSAYNANAPVYDSLERAIEYAKEVQL